MEIQVAKIEYSTGEYRFVAYTPAGDYEYGIDPVDAKAKLLNEIDEREKVIDIT